MNRTQLKELLRQAIYERGETKRRNKEKKKAAMRDLRPSEPGDVWQPDPRATKPELRAYQQDPDAYWKSKGMGTGQHGKSTPGVGGHPAPKTRHTPGLPRTAPSAWVHAGKSPVEPGPEGGARIPVNSPAPPNVISAVQQGGKVIIGRYYDAQGNYLGKSQGGQWIPNKQTYAPDDTQLRELELYNKIKEIESNGYKVKDKEMVKEMIREVLKSCK